MTYEAETTELKAEFNGDFDTPDDEAEAGHVTRSSCTHGSCTCALICAWVLTTDEADSLSCHTRRCECRVQTLPTSSRSFETREKTA